MKLKPPSLLIAPVRASAYAFARIAGLDVAPVRRPRFQSRENGPSSSWTGEISHLQDQQVQGSLGEAVLLGGRSFCDPRTSLETESECLGDE